MVYSASAATLAITFVKNLFISYTPQLITHNYMFSIKQNYTHKSKGYYLHEELDHQKGTSKERKGSEEAEWLEKRHWKAPGKTAQRTERSTWGGQVGTGTREVEAWRRQILTGKDDPSAEGTLSKAVADQGGNSKAFQFPFAALICSEAAHNPYKLFRGQDRYSAFHLQPQREPTRSSLLRTHTPKKNQDHNVFAIVLFLKHLYFPWILRDMYFLLQANPWHMA